MRRIFGLVILTLVVIGIAWGLSGIIEGFSHPSLLPNDIADFDFSIFIFGICLGTCIWAMPFVTVKRNLRVGIIALLANIVLGFILTSAIPSLDISSIYIYLSFFIIQFTTSFTAGFFI